MPDLSEEDYGILYSALENGFVDYWAASILYRYTLLSEWLVGCGEQQYLLDFTKIVIVFNNKELPECP